MAPALLQAATLALRAVASICPASPTCPQDDQCTTTNNGVSLQVSCATDYYGGDLQLAQVSIFASVEPQILTESVVYAGRLYKRLCEHLRVCRRKLRWGKLLHEEHP